MREGARDFLPGGGVTDGVERWAMGGAAEGMSYQVGAHRSCWEGGAKLFIVD